jgi:dolichol-phosphate mannosyltransferase
MNTCVIVPTYNEHDNIAAFVGAIYGVMLGDVTVCVVDDNSPDGTGRDVEALQPLFPSLMLITRPRKEGLGRAYAQGFREILAQRSFDVIVMIDADFSEHPLYIPTLLARLTDADVALGSRYASGARIVGWTLWRRALSYFGNRYARAVTGLPIRDMTMGFCAIKANFLEKVDVTAITSSGYAFIMELKFALWKAGARLAEVPIIFNERLGGESKFSGHIISEGIIAPWHIRFRKHS